MLDPIAYAWAHVNPRIPPPAELECRAVAEGDEPDTEQPKQRAREIKSRWEQKLGPRTARRKAQRGDNSHLFGASRP